ncbi:MAG: hypothetical protein V3U86_05920 [Acidobacteriota bacterium]
MTRLRQLIHEIHRRSLWRVLGIYVVGSWLFLQVVNTLADALLVAEEHSPSRQEKRMLVRLLPTMCP